MERAAPRLRNSFDGAAAMQTRLPGTVIDPQSLRVIIQRPPARGQNKKARSVLPAPKFNGTVLPHAIASANTSRIARHKRLVCRHRQLVCRQPGRKAGAEKRLTRVNVANTRDQLLVEQFDLDGLPGTPQQPGQNFWCKNLTKGSWPKFSDCR